MPSGSVIYGWKGSNDCPPPYRQVPSEKVCESAAADMGLLYESIENNLKYPKGCYSTKNNGVMSVWFNTAATGAPDKDSTLLCLKGTRPHSTVPHGPPACGGTGMSL